MNPVAKTNYAKAPVKHEVVIVMLLGHARERPYRVKRIWLEIVPAMMNYDAKRCNKHPQQMNTDVGTYDQGRTYTFDSTLQVFKWMLVDRANTKRSLNFVVLLV